MSEKTEAPSPRDVAIRVAAFVEDNYGIQADHPAVSEGLWLAMQLVGGPSQAAEAMRYCGVNFVVK